VTHSGPFGHSFLRMGLAVFIHGLIWLALDHRDAYADFMDAQQMQGSQADGERGSV
jgi:hypothetical protein